MIISINLDCSVLIFGKCLGCGSLKGKLLILGVRMLVAVGYFLLNIQMCQNVSYFTIILPLALKKWLHI